jgi:hypothetical protein
MCRPLKRLCSIEEKLADCSAWCAATTGGPLSVVLRFQAFVELSIRMHMAGLLMTFDNFSPVRPPLPRRSRNTRFVVVELMRRSLGQPSILRSFNVVRAGLKQPSQPESWLSPPSAGRTTNFLALQDTRIDTWLREESCWCPWPLVLSCRGRGK